MKLATIALAAAICAPVVTAAAPAAHAENGFLDGIDSVRFGVLAHNVRVGNKKNANKEPGVNITGELRWDSPGFLKLIWSPHPYLMASINTEGATSYAGGGLEWDWKFAKNLHFEPGIGYIIHDGEVRSPYPQGSKASEDFSKDHLLLGSRDLFRTNFTLTYDFTPHWAGQLNYEHISHGQILGHGRNQGDDDAGVRLVYRFH